MFFTYIHRKVSDNSVFYVGCGKKYRIKDFIKRSDKWKEMASDGGAYYEVVAKWDSREEALSHERLLISCFKDMGCELANQYVGGKIGVLLGPYPPSHGKKVSAAKMGVKRKPFTIETKQKMAIAQKASWAKRRLEQ